MWPWLIYSSMEHWEEPTTGRSKSWLQFTPFTGSVAMAKVSDSLPWLPYLSKETLLRLM